jgi:single-stranded DNA-binding protein
MAEKQSYNHITLLGFLGNEPVLEYAKQDGRDIPVAVFSLYIDTFPYTIKVWDSKGRACFQYLHKGSRVLVEGKQQVKHFTDSNNLPQVELQVTAKEVVFL